MKKISKQLFKEMDSSEDESDSDFSDRNSVDRKSISKKTVRGVRDLDDEVDVSVCELVNSKPLSAWIQGFWQGKN